MPNIHQNSQFFENAIIFDMVALLAQPGTEISRFFADHRINLLYRCSKIHWKLITPLTPEVDTQCEKHYLLRPDLSNPDIKFSTKCGRYIDYRW